MTPEQFRERLAALNMSMTEFCELTDTHIGTASYWGRARAPGRKINPVPVWVELLFSLEESATIDKQALLSSEAIKAFQMAQYHLSHKARYADWSDDRRIAWALGKAFDAARELTQKKVKP